MTRKLGSIVYLLVILAAVAAVVQAQWFSWESRSDQTFEEVIALGSEMGQRGYAPVRIESNIENGELRYSTIWIKEKDLGREKWQFSAQMNATAFQFQVEDMKAKGFAPIDAAVSPLAGQPSFSIIWGTGALKNWQLWHGLTAQEVTARTNEYARAGLELIDVNGYATDTGMRFAAIWGDAGFGQQINAIALTENEFRREIERLPQGFVPFNMNVSSDFRENRYSAIFVKDDSYLWDIKFGMQAPELKERFNKKVDEGFAPRSLSAYNVRLERRYAAIFAKPKPVEVKANPVFTQPTVSFPSSAGRVLDIAPVNQQTKVWCWLAIGEMVFQHFGVRNNNPGGNFQCGIIGTIMSETECYGNCFNTRCIRPSGSNYATVRMLKDYAWMSSKRVFGADEGFELPFAAIKANIDAGKPIIAGVSPTRRQYYDGAEHVALIVGYKTGPGGVKLVVNDPFPYPPMGNPYTRNGATALSAYQYEMPMRDFTQGLYWHWSIHNISIA